MIAIFTFLVCQSFFLKTLAISNGPLIKAFEHKNAYTNFFDGDDRRGRHTPANKLGDDIVQCVLDHFNQYVAKNQKCKKRIITDPEIRSLRHLYSIYTENHFDDLGLSYTSFKRIFNENNFSFPPDRVRNKPLGKHDIKGEANIKSEAKIEIQEILTFNDDEFTEKQYEMDDSTVTLESDQSQPKVLVQVPDASKFFANPAQVYEIQFIEIPINNQT